MQSSQAQTASLSRCPEDSPTVAGSVFKRLMGFLASILSHRARDEGDIVGRYAGCGWNDAIERQVVDAIATMRGTRL